MDEHTDDEHMDNDDLMVQDDLLLLSEEVVTHAKRRMTVKQLHDHDRRISIHHESTLKSKSLKKIDSLHYLNEIVKNAVDDGGTHLCPERRATLAALRPIETLSPSANADVEKKQDAVQEKNRQPERRATLAALRPIETLSPSANVDVEKKQDAVQEKNRQKILCRVQRAMHRFDAASFASALPDSTSTSRTLSTCIKWLRNRLRESNKKLHLAFRNGHQSDADRITKMVKRDSNDLLVLSQNKEAAELGAVCALMKAVGTGTSKREWIPVHKVGARWLEKTRGHRLYRKKKVRERALLPGEVRARRTLSPLLKKKVVRQRLESEVLTEQFSLTHHQLNLPGSSRRLTWHVT